MNKPTLNPYWIGFYFGQNVILHPDTGRWILTGYFDGQVVCRRNIGTVDEDCMSYPISEVQLILKRINPFLFTSLGKFQLFIKSKASEGYWMQFDEKFNQIIFEG